MAERAPRVDAPGATRWASLPIPELPDPVAARRAAAELDAAVRYLHGAHRLGRHCERPDHLAEMRREAEREVEAQADAMAALIRTVLRSLDLPDEIERHGLEVATEELRKLSAEYDT